ncbi:hypothetical protein AX15_005144 [Amanita polypyramis BW_CC]|nr:hypothetical protein AX15_005144 [Amanita polypyramis BW_CC]
MDHGGHGNHGHDMPMGPKCSVHMLWNTQILDTCIVFQSWHIASITSFVISFVVIVLLGVLYEYLRFVQRRIDVHVAQVISADSRGKARARSPFGNRSRSVSPGGADEDRELLTGRKIFRPSLSPGAPVPIVYRLLRATIYGATVFLSFFLMLVFMTYNAYLVLAVVLGAVIGHFTFGAKMNVDTVLADHASVKGMACH